MLVDLLIVFIIISVLLFILTVFLMDDYPMMAIPLIFAGMIFTVIVTFGLFNVETFYVGQNVTTGDLAPYLYADTTSYAEGYPWLFVFLFMLYTIIFVRIGFNLVKEALDERGRR